MCLDLLKSSCLTDGALSDSGIDSINAGELDIHFVRRNPPFARHFLSWSESPTAAGSDFTDLRQCLLMVSIVSGSNSSTLSSTVFRKA